MKPQHFTLTGLIEDASKYTTRGEFKRMSKDSYAVANKSGLLDVVCAHMVPKNRRVHTVESLTTDALKYSTLEEYKEKDINSYRVARLRGRLATTCAHMDLSEGTHSLDSLTEEDVAYSTFGEYL